MSRGAAEDKTRVVYPGGSPGFLMKVVGGGSPIYLGDSPVILFSISKLLD